MSLLTKLIWEAERESVVEFMQASASRSSSSSRASASQAAMQAAATSRQQAGMRRMRPNSPNRPNGPGEAGPVRVGGGGGGGGDDASSTTRAAGPAAARVGSSPTGVGAPISHNSTPGRPDVTVVGRARPSTMAHPIRSAKSKIVPEPDQIQSPPPPGPRRSSLLEPPGY
jgi:hypothetical protein